MTKVRHRTVHIRNLEDIIRYHDILDEILNNPEVNAKFNWTGSADIKSNLISIKRTLCWILHHDEGRWLEENMKAVEGALKEIGFDLKRVQ